MKFSKKNIKYLKREQKAFKHRSSNKALDIQTKRRLALYYSRSVLALKIFVVAFLFLTIFTNKLDFIKNFTFNKFAEISGNLGLKLQKVVIDGQQNINSNEIISLLNADTGTPIYLIDIHEVKSQLEKNDWIKSVVVERRLPNTIYIGIIERKPVAIWQVNKKLYLIDNQGDIIHSDNISKYASLLHVVGIGANTHARQLILDTSSNPDLVNKIVAAVRYGERRWDLILQQNIIVRMPEHDFQAAWQYLSKLDQAHKLFQINLKTLDLRDNKKYYLEYYK